MNNPLKKGSDTKKSEEPKKSKVENLKEELEDKIKSVTEKLEKVKADCKKFEEFQHKKDVETAKERNKMFADIKPLKKKLDELQRQLNNI